MSLSGLQFSLIFQQNARNTEVAFPSPISHQLPLSTPTMSSAAASSSKSAFAAALAAVAAYFVLNVWQSFDSELNFMATLEGKKPVGTPAAVRESTGAAVKADPPDVSSHSLPGPEAEVQLPSSKL